MDRATLERALQTDPSEELWLVYADLLKSIGDPRGEIITGNAKVEDHLELCLGPFAHEWQPYLEVEWSRGFFSDATVEFGGADQGRLQRQMMETLLRHPSAMMLESLNIKTHLFHFASGVLAFVIQHASPRLRSLAVHTGATPFGTTAKIWSKAPQLKQVSVAGPYIRLGVMDSTALTHLTIGEMDDWEPLLSDVRGSNLPNLKHLRLELSEVFPAPHDVRDLPGEIIDLQYGGEVFDLDQLEDIIDFPVFDDIME